jgi:RimJ/RimL family protein N-acetyltransferase
MAQLFSLTADKERVGKFCSDLMDGAEWGAYTALGLERDGELIGGVVYDGYYGPNVFAHIAGKPGTRWLTRTFLRAMFEYPFLQLGVDRITGPVASTNLRAMRLDAHLGFVLEATLRGAVPDGDLLLYVMHKKDCRFIRSR